MTTPFANVYHKRLVADTARKSCYICKKDTSTVLITVDNKDFFYVCPGHLNDRGFAQPAAGEDAASKAAVKRKKDLEQEIEKLKKEYEEKKKKRKSKSDDKEKEKGKDRKTDEEKTESQEDAERDQKIADLEKEKNGETNNTKDTDDGPRIFNLNRQIYQMRVDRVKAAQQARRTQQTVNDPLSFPSVPRSAPGVP